MNSNFFSPFAIATSLGAALAACGGNVSVDPSSTNHVGGGPGSTSFVASRGSLAGAGGGVSSASISIGCPPALPTSASACSLPSSVTCSYGGGCAGDTCCGPTEATCYTGQWILAAAPCLKRSLPTCSCPVSAPDAGQSCIPCPVTYTCHYCVDTNLMVTCTDAGVWTPETYSCLR